MAKLSTNGSELLRYFRERQVPAAEGRNVTWERVTVSYRSNGKVLEKHDCRFSPGPYDTPAEVAAGGRLTTWGWKVKGKVRAEIGAEGAADHMLAVIRRKGSGPNAEGWRLSVEYISAVLTGGQEVAA